MSELRLIHAEPPASDVVEVLQEVIDKAGEISSVKVVIVYKDGTTSSCHSTLSSVSLMVGALERAKFALIDESS